MNDVNELPSREKYWEELTDSEKINKLSRTVETLKSQLDSAAEVIQKLENHVHVEGRMYFANGGVTPLVWPNDNIFNRQNRGLGRF